MENASRHVKVEVLHCNLYRWQRKGLLWKELCLSTWRPASWTMLDEPVPVPFIASFGRYLVRSIAMRRCSGDHEDLDAR
jgi:hypothetical protein